MFSIYQGRIPTILVLLPGSNGGHVLSAAQLPIDLKSWAGGNSITVLSFWGLVQLNSPYFPHAWCRKASKYMQGKTGLVLAETYLSDSRWYLPRQCSRMLQIQFFKLLAVILDSFF